jgi:hypothetical protein
VADNAEYRLEDCQHIGYTPNGANWSDPDPEDVYAALNKLASLTTTLRTRSFTFGLLGPKAGHAYFCGIAPTAMTVTRIWGSQDGGTNVIFNIEKRTEGAGYYAAGTDLMTTDLTVTNQAGSTGTVNVPAVAARQRLYVTVTSVSGDVDELNVSVEATIDG